MTAVREVDQSGAAAVFEALFIEFGPAVRRLARRRTRDAHLAEDVLQETFLRVFRALDRLDGSRPAWPWIAAIASNVCTDLGRLRSSQLEHAVPVVSLYATVGGPDPADQCVLAEEATSLANALADLAPRQQRVLRLKDIEGRRSRDIAALDATSVVAVRSATRRARQALARSYLRRAEDPRLSSDFVA